MYPISLKKYILASGEKFVDVTSAPLINANSVLAQLFCAEKKHILKLPLHHKLKPHIYYNNSTIVTITSCKLADSFFSIITTIKQISLL